MPFRSQRLQPHARFFSLFRSDRIVFAVLSCSAAELKDGKRDTLRDGLAKDDVQRRTGGIVCAVRRSILLQEGMNKKKEETSKQQCCVKTILKENIINKERHMLKYFGFDDVLINEI